MKLTMIDFHLLIDILLIGAIVSAILMHLVVYFREIDASSRPNLIEARFEVIKRVDYRGSRYINGLKFFDVNIFVAEAKSNNIQVIYYGSVGWFGLSYWFMRDDMLYYISDGRV